MARFKVVTVDRTARTYWVEAESKEEAVEEFKFGFADGPHDEESLDSEILVYPAGCKACGTNGEHYCPADVARGEEEETEEEEADIS